MLKVNKYMKTLTHYIANMVLAAAACAVLAAVGVVLHTPTPAAQAAAVATTVSNNGLVGYWSFNDSTGNLAKDASGNNFTGILSGATSPVWSTGKFSGALTFDGTSSYVRVAAATTTLKNSHRLC
jgi:hypothetical protein